MVGTFVDAKIRECPSGQAGASNRLKAATQVMAMLEPLLTPDDGDRARYEAIRDLLALDSAPTFANAEDAVATKIEGLRFASVSRRRFADVSAEFEWSSDVLEDHDAHGRVDAFGLGTTSGRVRLSRYQEQRDPVVTSDVRIVSGYPTLTACRDGTPRSWQVYAFTKERPPVVTPSAPPRPAGWTPRPAAAVWAALANTVERQDLTRETKQEPQEIRRIAGELHQAYAELRDLETRGADPVELRRTGGDELDRIERVVDLMFEAAVHHRLDMRESGLEQLFVLEDDLRVMHGKKRIGRSRSFFDATQPRVVLSGSR